MNPLLVSFISSELFTMIWHEAYISSWPREYGFNFSAKISKADAKFSKHWPLLLTALWHAGPPSRHVDLTRSIHWAGPI